MTRFAWNADQYLKFSDHRLRPALDLLARVPLVAPRTAVDLGCGAGNVTARIRDRWPSVDLTGLDSSAEMLAQARKDFPAIRWIAGDIAAWTPPKPVDLLFSNAAIHWLPDHAHLLAGLMGQVAEGGALAVQIPASFGLAAHRLMDETARSGPWAERLAPRVRPWPVAEPSDYYAWLAPHARHVDVWETTYVQALAGEDPIVEWMKGTALRPFLQACADDAERAAFLAAYRARAAEAHPKRPDGVTLMPFRRIFMVALR